MHVQNIQSSTNTILINIYNRTSGIQYLTVAASLHNKLS